MNTHYSMKSKFSILLLSLWCVLIFYSFAEARQYEPGEFKWTSYVGDRTGALKTENIYRGNGNDEIRFIDVETKQVIYSVKFNNSDWYPLDTFSPDGKILYLLWQAQNARQGQTSKKIELIDIYSRKLIENFEVTYGDHWAVQFSLCSNIAYVTKASSWASQWNITYYFVDVKGGKGTIGSGMPSAKYFPLEAFITPDAKNIRLYDPRAGDVRYIPLPSAADPIPNDPAPVMPPVTVIPEGIVDGASAAKSYKTLTSLAKEVLSKTIEPAMFPVIKYAVRVIGADSRPIGGMSPGNFQVKEDGVNQTISSVELQSSNVPISIVLCLDTSGSINDTELAQINAAANKFVDLFSTGDRGAIIKFSTNVQLSRGFTADKAALKSAISASPPERGMTSLNDAVYNALTLSAQETNRKAVVVLTDGYDNDSSYSMAQIVNYSLANKIPVFAIGLGSPVNVSLLQKLAADCRGIYFNAGSVSKLEEVFNKVAENARSRYVIAYTTTNPKKDGTLRTVETTAVSGGNSGSAVFQYQAPQGTKPVAQIVSISPNPASTGQDVTFKGIGSGGSIVEYVWRSNLDGVIGNQEQFVIQILKEGSHTIYLKVRNSDGLWSDEVSAPLSVNSTRRISGRVQYENRPYNETGSGSDVVELKPVRFADFEIVRQPDGAVLGSGETKEDGSYEANFSARNNDKVILKCYAVQENANYNIRVIDAQGNKHSCATAETAVAGQDMNLDLEITEANNAGAFNILDTVMRGSDKVKELSGSVPPLIAVKWQAGVELSSAYENNVIELNGSSDDPDEYDDGVILHEYGHFVAEEYSCDKSPGGNHRSDDANQDIRLSWSEGWATFFSSLTRNNPKYIDILYEGGILKVTWQNYEDLDSFSGSLISYARGQDTEASVSSILWDVYDSINDAGDALTLGAPPIWNVFRGFNSSYDCVLEDFYNGFFSDPANETYRSQINNIFSERKVFYSTVLFKRGKIFTKLDGSAIPGGTADGLSSVLAVSDDLSILNINVFVDLPHNQRSDLLIKLISPSKKEVILHKHTSPQSGQRESIFVWYQPPYETIPDGNVPGTGQAVTAFDIFKNEPSKGDWILNVTDAGGQQSGNTGNLTRWKLEISGNQPPELDPIGDKAVDEGKLLEFSISAKDPNNQALTYSVTGLPQGAYFSPEKRLFSWLPDYNQQGQYTVHFEVTNGSLKATEDIKIIVNDVTIGPVSGKSVGVGLKVRVIQ